jgi:hypothetical protein
VEVETLHLHTSSESVTQRAEPRGHETGTRGVEPIGPHVFLWAGLDQGCLRNASGAARDLKIEGKQAILRTYGFEGEAGQEGEGWTRIRESSYRRHREPEQCRHPARPGDSPEKRNLSMNRWHRYAKWSGRTWGRPRLQAPTIIRGMLVR